MKVVIVTEAGKDIGLGHISRCNAFYDAFREKKGIKPLFVINTDSSLKDLLKDKNYIIFNWLKNKEKLFALIKNADMAVVDSYLAGVGFYQKIAEAVKIPVNIDDNKRIGYPRGIVVNGAIYAQELDYPAKKNITYLLGNKYTPLRKEFWKVPYKKINKHIESVLITFGGCDGKNMTLKILKFLNHQYPGITKHVVIGNQFNNLDKIEKSKDKKTNLVYCPDGKFMKELMLASDIAISAGGHTLYELARVGVPTIGICVSGNQERNLKGWQDAGFIQYIGWYNDNGDIQNKLIDNIHKLKSQQERIKRSNLGRSYVDGKGVGRIIKELIDKV